MKTDRISATTRSGRIRLHLACIRRGGSAIWHLKGILREIGDVLGLRSPHSVRL